LNNFFFIKICLNKNEIQYKIIKFIGINYKFDIDKVYFYIEPKVYIIKSSNTLCVSIYTWFGVNPKIISGFLHVDYERPYHRFLERNFAIIAQYLYKKISKYKLTSSELTKIKLLNAGTLSPFNKKKNNNGLKFGILSMVSYNYNTTNILDYFKEFNILDDNIDNLNDDICINAIDNLTNILSENIIEAMNEYKENTKNILKGPIIRINFENFPDCIHEYEKKFYYNLSKPISNDQKIVEINMKNKLKNEY
jgi:hypothetical protein